MPAPTPVTPSKVRSAAKEAKENAAPGERGDRSSYLSFLWQDKNAPQGQFDEDVHMHTMKGNAAPGILKQPSTPNKAYHYVQPAQREVKHLAVPGGNNEDVRMRTAKAETMKEKVLEPWEREVLASTEVKRRATVAQICELPQLRES